LRRKDTLGPQRTTRREGGREGKKKRRGGKEKRMVKGDRGQSTRALAK